MKNNITPSSKSIWMVTKKVLVSAAIIPALTLSSMGMAFAPVAYAAEGDVTVSIVKYINGEMATSGSAAGLDFPMSATWSDLGEGGIGAGTGTYALDSSNNYETQTTGFKQGADYSTQELLDGSNVSATCEVEGTPFALEGYTTGDTLEEAASASPSMSVPAFTGLSSNKYVIVWNTDCSTPVAPESVKVTIAKYIDGEPATTETANSSDFPMSATWSDLGEGGIGAGTGEYALSETGFNTSNAYEAVTADMQPGADYSAQELFTGDVVGATCEDGKPFALDGYTVGDNAGDAENGEPSMTIPTLTNIQEDQFIAVWNIDCANQEPPTPQESVQVHINKFIQGAQATSESADNVSFPMSATWNAENIGAGTGGYTLDSDSEVPYQTMTVPLDAGADYSTNEVLTGDMVGATCDSEVPFALMGYSTGNSYAEAASAEQSLTIPAFTNLQNDKYVIVWNRDCSITDGEIGGDVEGNNGVLAVTSIESVDTTATANGTFEDGWEYIFHITAPTNEQDLAMKFSNWQRTGGGGTIPVANNMRISSAQANNGGATILLTAENTYSVPALHMTGDLNPAMDGRQVEVSVEVAVPAGTPSGSYTTNYGVTTN